MTRDRGRKKRRDDAKLNIEKKKTAIFKDKEKERKGREVIEIERYQRQRGKR